MITIWNYSKQIEAVLEAKRSKGSKGKERKGNKRK
jgi:hypothetical protein